MNGDDKSRNVCKDFGDRGVFWFFLVMIVIVSKKCCHLNARIKHLSIFFHFCCVLDFGD
jgi:hypothetical protein